jgi:predicted dehydrogenase
MLQAALAAGKHIVCEKPLVSEFAQLGGILEAHSRRPDLKVASCSSRFQVCPPVRRARQLIADGHLGKIVSVRLQNSVDAPRPFGSQPAWKRDRRQSGGGLCMDWGVYDLDWLRFMLGPVFDPVALMGRVDHWRDEGTGLETGYAAQIKCRDGLVISLERRFENGPRFQRAEVRGTAGGINLPFMPGAENEHLVAYRYRDDKLEETTRPERMNGWDDILAYPVIDMVQAIAEGLDPASPLAAQPQIYRLIEALYTSHESGRSVAISQTD